jgi:8-oxo-dGTP diphosphatase
MNEIIPNLSVDCVIFGFHNKELHVLLTKRELVDNTTGELLISDYTLLGHHVNKGENLNDAARRVLREKTGLESIYLKQFFTFGDTNRLINKKDQLWIRINFPTVDQHVVTVGYYALVNSSITKPGEGHKNTKWFPVNKLPDLGFDHKKILLMALHHLQLEVQREPIVFELLAEKFTLSQLQSLYESIGGQKLDKRNFRKKISQMPYILALNEKQKDVSHKPAQVYVFSREVFVETHKEKFTF